MESSSRNAEALRHPKSLRLKTRGEGVRTVKILGGSGIEMRGRGCNIRCLGWRWSGVGRVGQECPTHTSCACAICPLERGLEVGANAARFFGGGEHPLIEGTADAAALVLVFDDDEAQEAASGGKACAHGIDAGEHAVEDEGHVVVFGELEDGEHALDGFVARYDRAALGTVEGLPWACRRGRC